MPTPVKFPQPDIPEIDMADSSPAGPSPAKMEDKERDDEAERILAAGALRRVYNRRNERARSRSRRHRSRVDDEDSSGSEEADEQYAVTRKTTNHYTLNMAGPSAPQSDLPFRLLG